MKKFLLSALLAAMMLPASAETPVDTNPVIETIMARRSVRRYKEQPVEREKLDLVARCGVNAPSAINKQPWAVRIVDDASFIDGVTREYAAKNPQQAADPAFKNMFRNAPAVIFIATPAGEGLVDAGLLGENIILAAQSLGLGTCCLGAPTRFIKTDPAAAPYLSRLDIPEGYELQYAIAIGYPDEAPDAKPRDYSKIKFID